MKSVQQEAAPELYKLLANDVRWQILAALTHSDLRVQEIVATVDKPINLVSYHLKLLRNQEIVHERRSSADGRDIYYSLDLVRLDELYLHSGAQLHPGLAGGQPTQVRSSGELPLRFLFLCTQNRARSQMAEGILRSLGRGRIEVQSAGVRPGAVHPLAIQALADMGIDIAGQCSKHLDDVRDQTFDLLITVCDQVREQCPTLPEVAEYIHWSIEDPIAAVEKSDDEAARRQIFAKTAHDLATRIRYLLLAQSNRGVEQNNAV